MSLESRDLSELLVSAVPPDLLDPLDWLVLLERLAVRYEASLCTNMYRLSTRGVSPLTSTTEHFSLSLILFDRDQLVTMVPPVATEPLAPR